MNLPVKLKHVLTLTTAFLACACAPSVCGESFYKEPPLFSMAPDEKKSVSTIARFGPVGMAIELHQPAFVMKRN